MASPATRELRGKLLYECYLSETNGAYAGIHWNQLSGVIKTRWERIASRYHEKIGRHG
jgi:hypothetical protein